MLISTRYITFFNAKAIVMHHTSEIILSKAILALLAKLNHILCQDPLKDMRESRFLLKAS